MWLTHSLAPFSLCVVELSIALFFTSMRPCRLSVSVPSRQASDRERSVNMSSLTDDAELSETLNCSTTPDVRVRRLNELEHQVLPSPLNPAHGRPRTRTCPHSTLYLNPHSTCRFAHFKGSHFPTSACNSMIHWNMLTFLLLILTSSDTGDWCGDITYTPSHRANHTTTPPINS